MQPHLYSLFAVALATSIALSATTVQAGLLDTAIHCRNTEYCSAGKIEGYVGPLDTAAQIKEAFAKTHWQKELIIFAEVGARVYMR